MQDTAKCGLRPVPSIELAMPSISPKGTPRPGDRCPRAQSVHRRPFYTATPPPVILHYSLSDASLQAFALASREPGRLMLPRVQTSCVAGAGALVGAM
ncbi:hypothetical protein EYF80_051137 [Liparis tanakae]|uniref:Uncharacterized protein n=1 Tax=Liparis tanakae TaxID=230148 RepID=A0A4Z2FCL9_9TELE|nr:hypothetical protein EYF80_051137 [Liparis tanakae]